MTTTRFTKEQLIEKAKENVEFFRERLDLMPQSQHVALSLHLAEITLASLEAEPVAYTEKCEITNMQATGLYLRGFPNNSQGRDIALFTATPAPTVTFYRDGIEAAAAWVDQQRESYDSEHGRHDPDTGFFEFGNDAQRDYSATLEEIAEGIRALHPNSAPPAPVVPWAWQQWIADAAEYLEGGLEADGELEAEGSIEAKRLLSRRAAMLQGVDGNSPVIGVDLASGPDRTVEVRYFAPPGYVMVPVEPTMAMLDEFDSIIDHGAEDSKDAWRRMIAAAPQQEVKNG